ncbi:MAG: Lrp/AsnC family transcriptional regulator [Alphaproteobacteria bacterium]|nr:Lrp/AsnC family transcriptional regulator [Alphaproteobacteria bacterium]
MAFRLDNVDNSILELVQKNGRITNVELAEAVGLSPPPCLRRLRALETNGIITGYKALVNKQKLGYNISAIIVAKLLVTKQETINDMTSKLIQLHTVLSCYTTLANSELIISVISKNIDTYEEFINTYVTSDKNIESFRAYLITQSFKNDEVICNKN